MKSSMLILADIDITNLECLGIFMDRELRFTDHVTNLLGKTYSKLKLLFSYRHTCIYKFVVTNRKVLRYELRI